MRILVVEDNASVALAVRAMLERKKYAVDVAGNGDSGLNFLLRQPYDAAIIDVLLPGSDGFSVVKAARKEGLQTPVLMLTAMDAVEYRVQGLDCGADDYLVKPFVEDELFARLRAITRRAAKPLRERLHAGALEVDVAARVATVAGKQLPLGATEFRMLEFLTRNAGIAFSREQLLEHLWDYDFEGSSNIVDVYISQLRRKLKVAGASGLIRTIWGTGYKLEA